jgi:MFS family permease
MFKGVIIMAADATVRTTNREILSSLNYNVKLIFAFYMFNSLGRGIWLGSVLNLYITELAKVSSFLGLVPYQILGLTSAASGITMTLFVFPSGYFADKYRRDIILKIATFFGLASIGFLIFGQSILFIMIALLLWGLFNALTRPSLESIFADSVKSGYRSKVYSWGNLINQLGMTIGPFINVGLFAIIGNKNNIYNLRFVMFFGIAISIVSIIIMYFFKDDKALDKESEAIAEEVAQVPTNKQKRVLKIDDEKAIKLIPILLVTSNVIVGIGAGMTIKFFANFFTDIYMIGPIAVQLLFGGTALMTGIMGVVAQRISLRLGRVQTIFLVQYIATACLLVISIYPPLFILAPVFLMRGSFMNAAMPLSRSILMDIIPKDRRGKWNSIQAIAWGLFWNVSAVIGGFIVGDSNFNLCFVITTFVYTAGLIPMIILMPMVGKEREAKDIRSSADGTKAAADFEFDETEEEKQKDAALLTLTASKKEPAEAVSK